MEKCQSEGRKVLNRKNWKNKAKIEKKDKNWKKRNGKKESKNVGRRKEKKRMILDRKKMPE